MREGMFNQDRSAFIKNYQPFEPEFSDEEREDWRFYEEEPAPQPSNTAKVFTEAVRGAGDFVSDTWDNIVSSGQDSEIINNLRAKVSEFTNNYKHIRNMNVSAMPEGIAKDRRALLASGGVVISLIEKTGMSAGTDGLGIAPVIIVAAAGAAIVAITKWLTEAYKLYKKIDLFEAEKSRGATSTQAASIVNSLAPASPNIGLGIGAGLGGALLIGGLAYFILKR